MIDLEECGGNATSFNLTSRRFNGEAEKNYGKSQSDELVPEFGSSKFWHYFYINHMCFSVRV